MQGGWSRSPCCRHHRRREENQFVGNLTPSSVDQGLEKQVSPFFYLFFILHNLHLEEVCTTDNTHCNNLQNKVTWYLYRQSYCSEIHSALAESTTTPQTSKKSLLCLQELTTPWASKKTVLFLQESTRSWANKKSVCACRNQKDLKQVRNLFCACRNQQHLEQARNLFCSCWNQQHLEQVRNLFYSCRNQ